MKERVFPSFKKVIPFKDKDFSISNQNHMVKKVNVSY